MIWPKWYEWLALLLLVGLVGYGLGKAVEILFDFLGTHLHWD